MSAKGHKAEGKGTKITAGSARFYLFGHANIKFEL